MSRIVWSLTLTRHLFALHIGFLDALDFLECLWSR